MFEHSMIMSSSYSTGRRICLHYVDCDRNKISESIKKIDASFEEKHVSVSTHKITTDSDTWESVIEKDPYFTDVQPIETLDEFIALLKKDRYLTGLDVTSYILSKTSCTHTQVEKLTYLCYADYLCDTGKKLFTDKIFAFDLGPVVDTTYQFFSGKSHGHPGKFITGYSDENMRLAIKSRLLFSEDGKKKISSIDRTLEKYKDHSAKKLVKITHRSGSPWDVTDKKSSFSEISDEDIIRCHHVEM